jgi:threonine 3-dehydrogenase
MAAMLQSGLDVSAVITHRFAAADYGRAFETMGGGQSGKVILDWAAQGTVTFSRLCGKR